MRVSSDGIPDLPAVAALVARNRSFRRFYEKQRIPISTLRKLIDLARLSPSGGNLQPLKFIPINNPRRNALIFPCMAWAGYLKDWPGPVPGERPSAYIIILGDNDIRKEISCDHGIAAQSIMLGATAAGLGGCMIGSIDRPRLRRVLGIPVRYEILLALALGHPRETVVLETARRGEIKYWRDAAERHHVPKRPLREIIL
ncbi:MAG: nitroreductase family protein [Kiritimatiellia bacterium]